MDVKTGKIVEDDGSWSFQQKVADGRIIKLKNPPDSKCKKCYGRGHVGYDTVHGRYIVCSCTQKKKVHNA